MRRSPQQLVSLPSGPGHLHLKLYHRIRSLILSGAWSPGTRLPSSRRLAKDLGVSRSTAILALDQLIADGWISTRLRSGTYVSYEAPPARPAPDVPPHVAQQEAGPELFAISPGGIDLFPSHQWSRIQARVWREHPTEALLEGSGAGWYPLRRAVAGHLHAVRGLRCSPEQVVIVSGTQEAMNLAVRLLGAPGESAWVEDPGYPLARQAVRAAGLSEVGIPVDAEGIRVRDGRAMAPGARLAFVTPACQFPTGAVMSQARRRELLAWAEKRGGFIVEDDWDFNSYFQAPHPPDPIAATDGERTIFIHSFSRLMFNGLRIAALVAPEPLVPSIIELREVIAGLTNMPSQIALADFIHKGLLSAHLRACRLAYAERRAAMHRALLDYMPDLVSIDPAQAGLHALVHLDGVRDSPLAAKARRNGFACSALSDFAFGDGQNSGQALLLGFAAFPPEAIDRGVQALAEVLFGDRRSVRSAG